MAELTTPIRPTARDAQPVRSARASDRAFTSPAPSFGGLLAGSLTSNQDSHTLPTTAAAQPGAAPGSDASPSLAPSVPSSPTAPPAGSLRAPEPAGPIPTSLDASPNDRADQPSPNDQPPKSTAAVDRLVGDNAAARDPAAASSPTPAPDPAAVPPAANPLAATLLAPASGASADPSSAATRATSVDTNVAATIPGASQDAPESATIIAQAASLASPADEPAVTTTEPGRTRLSNSTNSGKSRSIAFKGPSPLAEESGDASAAHPQAQPNAGAAAIEPRAELAAPALQSPQDGGASHAPTSAQFGNGSPSLAASPSRSQERPARSALAGSFGSPSSEADLDAQLKLGPPLAASTTGADSDIAALPSTVTSQPTISHGATSAAPPLHAPTVAQAANPGLPDPPASQVAQALAEPVKLVLASQPQQPGSPQIMTIRLAPQELGRVDIRIERADDGPAKIHLAVERPETLLRLVHDQPHLQHALDQAGIPQAGRTIQFSLSTENANGSGGSGLSGNGASGGGGHRSHNGYSGQPSGNPAPLELVATTRRRILTGLDITA